MAASGMLLEVQGCIESGELKGGSKNRVFVCCRAEGAAGHGGCIRAAAGPRAVAPVQVRGAR